MRQGSVTQATGRTQKTGLRVHISPGGLLGLWVERVLLLGAGGCCLWTCEAGLQETDSRALGTGRD